MSRNAEENIFISMTRRPWCSKFKWMVLHFVLLVIAFDLIHIFYARMPKSNYALEGMQSYQIQNASGKIVLASTINMATEPADSSTTDPPAMTSDSTTNPGTDYSASWETNSTARWKKNPTERWETNSTVNSRLNLSTDSMAFMRNSAETTKVLTKDSLRDAAPSVVDSTKVSAAHSTTELVVGPDGSLRNGPGTDKKSNGSRQAFKTYHTMDAPVNESITESRIGMNEISTPIGSTHNNEARNTFQILRPWIPSHGQKLKIAGVNLDYGDVLSLQKTLQNSEVLQKNVNAEHNLTWDDLYPDMETSCPLSLPHADGADKFDAVVVKVPCNATDNSWAKNVTRHLALLQAAVLAANNSQGGRVTVLVMSECRPTPNLFVCSELRAQRKDLWLFMVNVKKMKVRLSVPVGSCELTFPLSDEGFVPHTTKRAKREAYATVLHSSGKYVCGAIVLAHSLKLTGTTRDLVLLLDNSVSKNDQRGLRDAGWILHKIKRIRCPYAEKGAYNEWNYSKLRLWGLTAYSKVVFIDADLLVLRNIDLLFSFPELSARGNYKGLFNSGVMVIEPSRCTLKMLMSHMEDIISYNGGDQGYLNEIFTWWHRIPYTMNFFKYMIWSDPEDVKTKTGLFLENPPSLYAIHYFGLKPWQCYRDYDCNWDVGHMTTYANDAAHAQWWKAYDLLPSEAQRYCWLDESQKKLLENFRVQAQERNSTDAHWNISILDPRLHFSRIDL